MSAAAVALLVLHSLAVDAADGGLHETLLGVFAFFLELASVGVGLFHEAPQDRPSVEAVGSVNLPDAGSQVVAQESQALDVDAFALVQAKVRNQLLGRPAATDSILCVGPNLCSRNCHSARRRKVDAIVKVLGEVIVYEDQVDRLPAVLKRVERTHMNI